MHLVDAERALDALGYVDLICLSERLRHWALTEDQITADQRTDLMLMAVDYERLSESCGMLWKPRAPNPKRDFMRFIANARERPKERRD